MGFLSVVFIICPGVVIQVLVIYTNPTESTEETKYCSTTRSCPAEHYCEPGFGFCMPCSYICKGVGAKRRICQKHGCTVPGLVNWEQPQVPVLEHRKVQPQQTRDKPILSSDPTTKPTIKTIGHSGSKSNTIVQSNSPDEPLHGYLKDKLEDSSYSTQQYGGVQVQSFAAIDYNIYYIFFWIILVVIVIVCTLTCGIIVWRRYQCGGCLHKAKDDEVGSTSRRTTLSRDEETGIIIQNRCIPNDITPATGEPLVNKPADRTTGQQYFCGNHHKGHGQMTSLPVVRSSDTCSVEDSEELSAHLLHQQSRNHSQCIICAAVGK